MINEKEFKEMFPIWDKLEDKYKKLILKEIEYKSYKKGEVVHDNSTSCTGLILVMSGKLRAYMISNMGKELSLYYLFDRDICLMSASCVMRDITFDIFIEAMEDTKTMVIPTNIYKLISKNLLEMSNYVSSIMSSRLSDVMWLLEQVLFKKLDTRLAEFLLFHNEDNKINMTHEEIANHLGSAREVVSRMLKHFESNGLIRLFRGCIEIIDNNELFKISEK